MYVPESFNESRPEVLHELIMQNPLGVLVSHGEGGLDANHLPFMLEVDHEGHGVLIAHVARGNRLWRELQDSQEALVVFRGVQGYITPSWYPGKHETHRRVPTWNYEVVHAHGTLHVRDDEKFVRGVVARLTRQHEAGQAQPWKMGDAPADFLTEELKHIVGIEMRIERLIGKRKLNQHHEQRDREGAIQGLEASGHQDLAQAMKDTAKSSA